MWALEAWGCGRNPTDEREPEKRLSNSVLEPTPVMSLLPKLCMHRKCPEKCSEGFENKLQYQNHPSARALSGTCPRQTQTAWQSLWKQNRPCKDYYRRKGQTMQVGSPIQTSIVPWDFLQCAKTSNVYAKCPGYNPKLLDILTSMKIWPILKAVHNRQMPTQMCSDVWILIDFKAATRTICYEIKWMLLKWIER